MPKSSIENVTRTLPRLTAVLSPVLASLRGRKTYLGAALAAAIGVYHLTTGEGDRAAEMIALALGLAGLRGAIGRSEAPTVALDVTTSGRPLAPFDPANYREGEAVVDEEAFRDQEGFSPAVERYLAGSPPQPFLYPGTRPVDPAALDPRRLRPPAPPLAEPDHVELARFEDDGGPPPPDPEARRALAREHLRRELDEIKRRRDAGQVKPTDAGEAGAPDR
jgi:hypothetical protein